jgi:hypothetical protein
MEMMQIRKYGLLRGVCTALCILLCCIAGVSQPVVKKYFVRDGRMVIELSRLIPEKELDQFIHDFDLDRGAKPWPARFQQTAVQL